MAVDVVEVLAPAHGHPGRGGEPAAEPLTPAPDPDVVDQVVIDAEFVAMVLTERLWGEERPSPPTPPPGAAGRTRRGPPPSGAGPRSARAIRLLPVVTETPQVRRRTGPGPRSPPLRVTPPFP